MPWTSYWRGIGCLPSFCASKGCIHEVLARIGQFALGTNDQCGRAQLRETGQAGTEFFDLLENVALQYCTLSFFSGTRPF